MLYGPKIRSIVTNGVFLPERVFSEVHSAEEAEGILKSISPINLTGKEVPLFEGRIEDYLRTVEKHNEIYPSGKGSIDNSPKNT